MLPALQSRQGQDPSTALERALGYQILASERRRLTLIAGIAATAFAFSLLGLVLFPAQLRSWLPPALEPTVLVGLSGLVLAYELMARATVDSFIRNGRPLPTVAQYATALVETSLPTLGIVLFSGAVDPVYALTLPPPWAYSLFIIASTLRLDFRLSMFTGAVAASEYVALAASFIAQARDGAIDPTLLAPFPHIIKAGFLLGAGILAGVVGRQLRQQFINAFSSVEERNRVIDRFGQHVSPAVVDKLLAQDVELGGEVRHVCVMFLDIRDFTAFAERRHPDEAVAYLNTLFEFMIDSVNRHHGIVNKFLGDGFMAVFGAPISDGRDSANAVAAAREILAQVSELSASGAIPPTRIGIGLHAGPALTGTIGSALRKEYTIIGDTVYLAARIEQLNKQFGSQLLVSEAIREAIGDGGEARSLGPIRAKGKAAPVPIYQLA